MYKPEARKFVKHVTVAQLCSYLIDNVPANAVVHVCGDGWMYFQNEHENNALFRVEIDSGKVERVG